MAALLAVAVVYVAPFKNSSGLTHATSPQSRLAPLHPRV
ncbi:unnamed protein product, partial [Ascophyllum nodosum]